MRDCVYWPVMTQSFFNKKNVLFLKSYFSSVRAECEIQPFNTFLSVQYI